MKVYIYIFLIILLSISVYSGDNETDSLNLHGNSSLICNQVDQGYPNYIYANNSFNHLSNCSNSNGCNGIGYLDYYNDNREAFLRFDAGINLSNIIIESANLKIEYYIYTSTTDYDGYFLVYSSEKYDPNKLSWSNKPNTNFISQSDLINSSITYETSNLTGIKKGFHDNYAYYHIFAKPDSDQLVGGYVQCYDTHIQLTIDYKLSIPNVTNQLPANNSVHFKNNITFSISLTNETPLANITLNIDNKSIKTDYINQNEFKGISYFNEVLNNGDHSWFVEVCNLAKNCIKGDEYKLLINNTPPIIKPKPHENISNKSFQTFRVDLEDSSDLANLSLYTDHMGWRLVNTYQLYGITGNTKWQSSNGIYSVNHTFNNDGIYNYSFQACDKDNFCTSSKNYSILIDTTSPNIINYTSFPKEVRTKDNITFFAKANDSFSGLNGIKVIIGVNGGYLNEYSLNESGYFILDYNNFKKGDIINWRITAMDNAGNIKESDSSEIEVLNTKPILSNFRKKNITEDSQEVSIIDLKLRSYDADKDDLEYVLDILPDDIIICRVDKTILKCKPKENKNGNTNINITLFDGIEYSETEVLKLIVEPVNDAPEKIEITNPQDNSWHKSKIKFEWQRSKDIEDDDIVYTLEIDKNKDFDSVDYIYNTTNNYAEVLIKESGIYFARVKPYDLKDYGNWSGKKTFFFDVTEPEVKIEFDITNWDIKIKGIDNLDNNPTVEKISSIKKKKIYNNYIISDKAGNSINVSTEYDNNNKKVKLNILSISYNDAVFVMEDNSFENLKSKQVYSMKKDVKVTLDYNNKKNLTEYKINPNKGKNIKGKYEGHKYIIINSDGGKLLYNISD